MYEGKRIAIVASGGGMRCAHGAGAWLGLKNIYGFKNPDIVIASSGNVGSAVYALSGQYEIGKEIWTKALTSSRFISLSRLSRIIDIDYLIDVVFKKEYPLNLDAFRKTVTKYFFSISDVQTRTARFVTNEDIQSNTMDIFEVMRATKAMPLLVPRVSIAGKTYEDGAVRAPFGYTVQKAFKEGADVVLAIDNRPSQEQKTFRRRVKHRKDIILIQNERVPAGLLTNNEEKIQMSFDMGYTDVAQNKRLQRLFSGHV